MTNNNETKKETGIFTKDVEEKFIKIIDEWWETVYKERNKTLQKEFKQFLTDAINNRKAELLASPMDTIRRREIMAVVKEFDKLLSIINH